MLETAVRELRQQIAEHDGQNVAGRAFTRRVDELLSVFYDDIGAIVTVSTRTLFDLFVIKVLYVGRQSRQAGVVDYLGQLLDRYLYTHELFTVNSEGKLSLLYLSDLLRETQHLTHSQNLFEAYRRYGDNSLFVTGVFPTALRRRRGKRASFVDRAYYVSTGKTFYGMASKHDLAESTQQRELLEKLSAYFEVYMDALNEMSERYILGFDLPLIADKMLDSFNRYRESRDERHLQDARRYAAILKVDPQAFPGLLKHQRAKLPPPDEAPAS